jgi:hypothetical protein
MSWSLAIDFGTSNTAAAVRVGSEPPWTVKLSSESDQMPSAVMVGPNGLLIGADAKHAMLSAPEAYLGTPKRHLGEDSVWLADREVAPEVLVAEVLKFVVRRAARYAGGGAPDTVILTHPQDWAGVRKRALLAAWERTGIAVGTVRLVSEPVAAVSWFARRAEVPAAATVAVLDYGGGTCDVAVLRRTADGDEPFTVIGYDGAPDLGGTDLDQLLTTWVREELDHNGHQPLNQALSRRENLGALRTLHDQVRRAKEALTEWEYADVAVAVGSDTAVVTITVEQFDRLVAPEMGRIKDLAERVLHRAGVDPHSLHALYLTGGSSYVRAVHTVAREILGDRPSTLGDPKLVVALGAHHVAASGTIRPAAAVAAPLTSRPADVDPNLSSVANRLLTAQPQLASALGTVPAGVAAVDHPATLAALVRVPGLIDDIARHPDLVAGAAARTGGISAGRPEDLAAYPVRVFFADSPAWSRATASSTWRRAFASSTTGPEWVRRALPAWERLSEPERDRVWAAGRWNLDRAGDGGPAWGRQPTRVLASAPDEPASARTVGRLAAVGLALAFLLPPIGLVISAVASSRSRAEGLPAGVAALGFGVGTLLTVLGVVVAALVLPGLV